MKKDRRKMDCPWRDAQKTKQHPVAAPGRTCRTTATLLLAALSLICWSGCAALHPIGGIPASYLPHELKSPSRSGKRTIDLSLLKQTPPEEYLVDAGDTLAIYIEGVLGDRSQVPPVHFPRGDESIAPSLGFPIPIRDDGTISLPLMKTPLNVRGMTLTQVEQALRKKYTTVGWQILRQGRDRILVSLLKPREYAILVIRQEGFGASGSSGGPFNLGNLKEGTGQIVNLPAYKNDVLHALAKTGGLPGTDAENIIYIIRDRRSTKSRRSTNRTHPTPVNMPQPISTGNPVPGLPPRTEPIQQQLPDSMMPNNGEPLESTFINPLQFPYTDAQDIWEGFQPAHVIQDGAIVQQISGNYIANNNGWGNSLPMPNGPAMIQPAVSHAWGHSQVSAPIPPTPDPVSSPPELPSPAETQTNAVPSQTQPATPQGRPLPYLPSQPIPSMMSGGQWYASDMFGGGQPTVDNPRIIKIPIRLSAGETVSFTEEDVILENGDIVFIESRDTEIFYTAGLLGGGQYTLPRDYDLDILGALSIAQNQQNQGGGGAQSQNSVGGMSALNQDVSFSASDCVILRQMPNGKQVPIKVDLYRALRYPEDRVLIQPGDYIILQYTRLEAVGAFFERYLLEPFVFGIAASQLTSNNRN